MEELAATISASTALLTKELQEKGHGLPDFSENGPVYFPWLSPEAALARSNIRSAAEQLIHLTSGPFDSFVYLNAKILGIGTLRALVNLQIPQQIPLRESRSFAQLSEKVGVAEPLLTRLVRFAICCGYMAETTPGFVSHNALSSIFVRDEDAGAGVLHMLNIHYPASVRLLEAVQMDPTGTKENQTPFSIAFGTPGQPLPTFWEYSEQHPDVEREFHGLMVASACSTLWSFQHVVDCYDWNQVKTVVDIGGSTGHISMAISDKFPHIKFVVQDLNTVVETSQKQLPAQYAEKITFAPHDFFDIQPTIADCYLLRMILHNWSDEDTRKILSNLIPALQPGSKIIIIDHVVLQPGEGSIDLTQMVRNIDVRMYSMLATKERSKDDLVALVADVDKRLQLQEFHSPHGSAASMLVFQFAEDADRDGSSVRAEKDEKSDGIVLAQRHT